MSDIKQDLEIAKKIDVSKFNFSEMQSSAVKLNNAVKEVENRLHSSIRTMDINRRNKEEREEQFKLDVVNTLKGIENNTSYMSIVVDLLQKNKENQEEILNLITEINGISTATTLEDGQSKYRKVMGEIQKLESDFETFEKLKGYADIAWLTFKTYLSQKTGIEIK